MGDGRCGSGVVVREGAGKLPVGVGLGEQVVGLLLDRGDGVGSGDPPQRGRVEFGELDEASGELRGVAWLLAVHASLAGDDLGGAFGVVVD